MLFLFCGCAASQKGRPSTGDLTSSVLPYTTGGIVATEAHGSLVADFTEAARRLLSWKTLVKAQSETIAAFIIRFDTDVTLLLKESAQRAAVSLKAINDAMGAWSNGNLEPLREIAALLKAIQEQNGLGARLCDPPSRIRPPARLAATLFETDRGVLLVLGEVRGKRDQSEALLLEIHFFVSTDYKAGVNVYHVANVGDGRVLLTVHLFSWITQTEGFFGTIPRTIAEGQMRSQVERTWQDVADYLAGVAGQH